MRLRFLAVFLALAALALPAPASAATAIFYSKTDLIYGWCAGYGKGKAESCAQKNCRKSGGEKCELALECGGGWGAVAFSQDPADVAGMSCGLNSAGAARYAAMASSVAVANALCWTYDTFDDDGDARSDKDNDAFDRLWLAQVMLDLFGIDRGKDGVLDGKTRDGLEAFQARARLDETGELDDALWSAMFDAVGGPVRLVNSLKGGLDSDEWKDLTDSYYAIVTRAAPVPTINGYWKELDAARRKQALAVYLNGKAKCTPPATSVTYADDTGIWTVECAEATYAVQVADDGRIATFSPISK